MHGRLDRELRTALSGAGRCTRVSKRNISAAELIKRLTLNGSARWLLVFASGRTSTRVRKQITGLSPENLKPFVPSYLAVRCARYDPHRQ